MEGITLRLILLFIFTNISMSDSLNLLNNKCFQQEISLPINLEEIPLIQNFILKNISYPWTISPVINQEQIVIKTNEKSLNYTSYYVSMNPLGRVIINDNGVDETYYPLKILIDLPSHHSIEYHKADIEMQVIHQEINNPNKMLVISVLIVINDSILSMFNSFKIFSTKENIISKLNNDPNNKIKISNLKLIEEIPYVFANLFNISNIATPTKMYYYYKTKITSPAIFPNPSCDKEVKYLVMNHFQNVKKYQYDYLKNLFLERNLNFNINYNTKQKPDVYLLYNSNFTVNSDYINWSSSYLKSISVIAIIVFIIIT